MNAFWRLACPLALGFLVLGCSTIGERFGHSVHGQRALHGSGDGPQGGSFRPDRYGYERFRAAHGELLDPNYLPFMLHRLPVASQRADDLVFCRWVDADMPLKVVIDAPDIDTLLEDEFRRLSPEVYVGAVLEALRAWEEALEGLVRFRQVNSQREAHLHLRMLGESAPTPEPEMQVLGATEGLRGACSLRGGTRRGHTESAGNSDAVPLAVDFEVSELAVYVADQYGLLTPEQVRRTAMHELGHALGMSGHSPLSTDLMYRMLGEDLRVDALSSQDVNSFLSLYRIPNGTRYGTARFEEPSARPPATPPVGAAELSLSPHVNARLGFDVRTPSGWLRSATPHGLFAVDGQLWDHDASLEIFVWPRSSIEHFLERFGPTFFDKGWLRHRGWMVVGGRRALRIAIEEDDGRAAEFTLIELGDGRVMLFLTHCPIGTREVWQPWFRASLASLQIW